MIVFAKLLVSKPQAVTLRFCCVGNGTASTRVMRLAEPVLTGKSTGAFGHREAGLLLFAAARVCK